MTRNAGGRGEVTHVGFMPTDALNERLLADAAGRAGVTWPSEAHWPLIVRQWMLHDGHRVRYLLNYSAKPVAVPATLAHGTDLLTNAPAVSMLSA